MTGASRFNARFYPGRADEAEALATAFERRRGTLRDSATPS
ncbi:hypothetical protein BIWAKO_02609 [Bosea sp. BIWAKO-01]|nr:hypothetical protein BIWAKO_02609 [Bosea sp. BIWAKO-01]